MKAAAAPDSFKGNLTSSEAAAAIERGIRSFDPTIEVIRIPMADGGEGTVAAAASQPGGRLVTVEVTGPCGDRISASYADFPRTRTAVIETASAAGLDLVPPERRDPSRTTTRGIGELIRHAVDNGNRTVIVGLGGSATNDGGMGAAAALGVRFLDASGSEIDCLGCSMGQLHSIDAAPAQAYLKGLTLYGACDVTNPLYGKEGAAYVYAPQKGADERMVRLLDAGLRQLARTVRSSLGVDVSALPGAGAAGGLGGGLAAFLGAQLRSGVELIMEAVGMREALSGVDLIITGEGRTDSQTAYGKVPAGIGRLARELGIPVVCLSGALGPDLEQLYETGITALFSIADRDMTLDYSMAHSRELIERAAENITRLFAAARNRRG
jgi:glycerate 2-kinase